MADAKPTISASNELLQPEGHPELGYRIFALLSKVIQYKESLGLPEKWNRNYELGKNKHWRQSTKKAALVSANLIYTHRQRTVNMLTDNNPTFNIKQVGQIPGNKEDLFTALLKTAEWWWSDTEQQAVLEASVLNGETFGCTIEKVLFNPDLEQNLGEVEALPVDPFHFGWWPVKQDNLQKCEALFHYYPITVREARRRWPEFASQIRADEELLKQLNDNRLEVQANSTRKATGYLTNFANTVKNILNLSGQGGANEEEGEEILVVECWVKDYTREPGNNGTEADKYPGNIRRVTTLNGGELVVDDRPNPSINPTLNVEQASQTYLWDKFPFLKVHSVTDTGNPWGMSDLEQLEMLNIEVNKTLSQFTLVKDKVARVKLINPRDSGVDNTELNNAPGIINPASALVAQGIRYLDPPRIDMDMIQALNVYKEFFFLVAGSFDLDQADTGKNVIAYKAIAALLERASTMLRGKIRNYSRLIRERGRMYLGCMQNWYDTERFISYEQDGDEITRAINGNELIIPAKLSVVSGSTMPVSKIQEREESLALFDKGAIDAEELLKKIDWPEWKSVVSRMKSGPVGEFIEKLGMMGFPPTLLSALQEIGIMEFKDFEQALEQGEIPFLAELLQPAPGEEGAPEEPSVPPVEQAEVALKQAQAEKVQAEIRLIDEKINTERANQAAIIAGVEFDKTKLSQEQARLVSDIRAQERGAAVNEYGALKSAQTAEQKVQIDGQKAKEEADRGKTSDKRGQGPYRERGLASNNKEQAPKR